MSPLTLSVWTPVQTPRNPEAVLELAYIDDPALFDRDGQTRRSKARADLKNRTGWSDEQIEGWRIMLERDVRLSRLLPCFLPPRPPSSTLFVFCRRPVFVICILSFLR